MTDLVECRSENEYAERPLAFYWCGERLQIDEILSGWRTPEGKWFRIIALNGEVFELHYNEGSDIWNIHHIHQMRSLHE